MSIESISDGLFQILIESTTILNEIKEPYIIIGGWSPFFLNNSEDIKHPGTKDVDILLKNGSVPQSLKSVFIEFIKHDYLFSAKNEFQLLKTQNIHGSKFVYNIDFLHPKLDDKNTEIYVDHLDLGIPIEKYRSKTFMLKSIVTPNSMVLFDGHYIQYELEHNDSKLKFNLMNEVGLLITKAESIKIAKRKRDSLDVFMAIKNNRNYTDFIKEIIKLRISNRPVYNALYGIRESYDNRKMIKDVLEYYNNEEIVKKVMDKFFIDTKLNEKAENV